MKVRTVLATVHLWAGLLAFLCAHLCYIAAFTGRDRRVLVVPERLVARDRAIADPEDGGAEEFLVVDELADRHGDAGGAVLPLELLERRTYNDEVEVSDGRVGAIT